MILLIGQVPKRSKTKKPKGERATPKAKAKAKTAAGGCKAPKRKRDEEEWAQSYTFREDAFHIASGHP